MDKPKSSNLACLRMGFFSSVITCSMLVNAQTIVNTENMMASSDSAIVLGLGLDGDFQTGNVNLAQFNSTIQLGKRIDKHLIRIIGDYEYLSEDNIVISSDITSQLRYNYFIKKNSVFAFTQFQKVKSLKQDYRFLAGGGYRHNFYRKDKNYFDLSSGLFYEKELYLKDSSTEVQIENMRLSNSAFFRFNISKKAFLNTTVYYQININNLSDTRLFLEPRVYYEFNKISTYITCQVRHHSTPYVDIKKTDSQLKLGFEYQF